MATAGRARGIAAGAGDSRKRELDNVVLERAAFVCCDSLEQARIGPGDLIEPVQAGVLDWLEVHELHEVVSGDLQGRQSDDDIVVFKSNGLAAWDVAIGAAALDQPRARRRDDGLERSRATDRRDHVVADRPDQLRAVEQAARAPAAWSRLPDVGIFEDLAQRASALDVADDVRGDPLLVRGTARRTGTRTGCAASPRAWPRQRYPLAAMRPKASSAKFAERTLRSVDENGAEERIVVWIERRQGAVWAVSRAVNPQHRSSDAPRRDYLFEATSWRDALEVAEQDLSDDSRVSAQDGQAESIAPFDREEILKKLERWFFGHER